MLRFYKNQRPLQGWQRPEDQVEGQAHGRGVVGGRGEDGDCGGQGGVQDPHGREDPEAGGRAQETSCKRLCREDARRA